MLDRLPDDIIYEIVNNLAIYEKHRLCKSTKYINNLLILDIYLEKYRKIRLRIFFILFKEKIFISQIAKYIQEMVMDRLSI